MYSFLQTQTTTAGLNEANIYTYLMYITHMTIVDVQLKKQTFVYAFMYL